MPDQPYQYDPSGTQYVFFNPNYHGAADTSALSHICLILGEDGYLPCLPAESASAGEQLGGQHYRPVGAPGAGTRDRQQWQPACRRADLRQQGGVAVPAAATAAPNWPPCGA